MFLFIKKAASLFSPHGEIQIHPMFLFISPSFYYRICAGCIQIHPMFLFIRGLSGSGKSTLLNSNTSYVLIYLKVPNFSKMVGDHSNTSYVLIYRSPPLCRLTRHGIQIHPMFLFIYCSLYFSWYVFYIQIHPMFLFIIKTILTMGGHSRIQIHLMFLFIVFF